MQLVPRHSRNIFVGTTCSAHMTATFSAFPVSFTHAYGPQLLTNISLYFLGVLRYEIKSDTRHAAYCELELSHAFTDPRHNDMHTSLLRLTDTIPIGRLTRLMFNTLQHVHFCSRYPHMAFDTPRLAAASKATPTLVLPSSAIAGRLEAEPNGRACHVLFKPLFCSCHFCYFCSPDVPWKSLLD